MQTQRPQMREMLKGTAVGLLIAAVSWMYLKAVVRERARARMNARR